MYTQEDFEKIQAAQKVLEKHGGLIIVYSDKVSIDGMAFTKTFNPEDCEVIDGFKHIYPETAVNGMTVTANLDQREYAAWLRRWEK